MASPAVFTATISRGVDLVSWPSAKWRSDYTGHVSYWNNSSSEDNQGVFFNWFNLSSIQTELANKTVTNIRIRMARQISTGNNNTLAIPLYTTNLNATTYGTNRTTTLPNTQAVDPQNIVNGSYITSTGATISLQYSSTVYDYEWSTNITGTTAENIGEGFKAGTITGIAAYWAYVDNAHYCKLMAYNSSYPVQIEFTYVNTDTPPTWGAVTAMTTPTTATIAENTSSIGYSWSAATDVDGDAITYTVYRMQSTNGGADWTSEQIQLNVSSRSYSDTGFTKTFGYKYKYIVYAYANGETTSDRTYIESQVVTINTLTEATLSSSTTIAFATPTIAWTWTGADDTTSDANHDTFTYRLSNSDGLITNPNNNVTSAFNMKIWRTGDSVPPSSEPYIKFSDLYDKLGVSSGTITFVLTTYNAYGSSKTSNKIITGDLRTNPTGLGTPTLDATDTSTYDISGTRYYIPNRKSIVLTWDPATDPLTGTGITYDVQVSLNSGSYSNIATGLTAATTSYSTTVSVLTTCQFKVIARASYGNNVTSSASTSVDLHYYNRPTISFLDIARTQTTATVNAEIVGNSTIVAAKALSTNGLYYQLNSDGYIAMTNDTTPSQLVSVAETSTATFYYKVQDEGEKVIFGSSDYIIVSITIAKFAPLFSVREKGVGVGIVNDGTGNYSLIIVGKVNSVVDSLGGIGFYENGVKITSGTTDHGALGGLGDDDHTQYHNDSRGDSRYQAKDATLTSLAAVAATAANDFIVADGADSFTKKTLAETKTILLNNQYFLFAGPTAARTFTFPDADSTIPAYSEGSFSPTLFGSTTAGTWTYTDQIGHYIKIGKNVSFQIQLKAATISGSPAGNLMIGGLPFSAAAWANVYSIFHIGLSYGTNMTHIIGYHGTSGGTSFGIYAMYNNGTSAFVPVGNLSTGDLLVISGSYQATT